MKLKFIKPSDVGRNIKATIHKSGKLGFTTEASDKLKINEKSSIDIAINEEEEIDDNLYVVVHDTVKEDAFKVSKAGGYHYVNTKSLFDSLKIDYSNIKKTIIYDIIEDSYDGNKIFVFKKREVKKKEITAEK